MFQYVKNVFGVKKGSGQLMKITNLDPKKYKRFFAFGCSNTSYNWLTWADIIGNDIEFYENWAAQGAGNYFIFNSVIEADARYNFNKDDLVIVSWSTKEREDRYRNNAWLHDTPVTVEKTYGKEWVKKFALDFRGYLIRDLSFIKAIQTILINKDCDWANLSWNELIGDSKMQGVVNSSSDKESLLKLWREACEEVYNGNQIRDFFEHKDVIKVYQDVFTNISGVYRWFESDCIVNQVATRSDGHARPLEALAFLDWVWPNNTISDNTRKYVEYCEKSGTLERQSVIRL